jgi:hypothetical protein
MSSILRLLAAALCCLAVLGLAGFGGLALAYNLPDGMGPARLVVAAAYPTLALGGLVLALWYRRMIAPLLPFALATGAFFFWWSTIEASNDRLWQPDVARLAAAEIDGNRVTLRNVRRFTYRTTDDFTPAWHERTVDLDRLETLDLYAVYWMGDAIAHTMVSFGFAGEEPVTFSIETRKEVGEAYSTLAGFFRQYELYYVVSEEPDVVALRTSYREPREDVYLFRVDIPAANIRRFFLHYLEEINRLVDEPKWYNTLTTNCTTAIVTHVRALGGRLPISWRVVLSGYFPALLYDRGVLDQSLPFPELRAASLINDRARAALGSPDFSARIRDGLPGMELPPPQ